MQTFNNSRSTDYFTSEFEINDAPVGARNLLTKGFVRDEINRSSGAAISTRGRFISKNDPVKNSSDRPLYLFIQGPTKQSIELAIHKIHEIIHNDIGNPIRSLSYTMQNNSRSSAAVISAQPMLKPPPLMGINTNVTHVEKLYIGLDGVPSSFDLRGKIIGPGGSNLHFIRSETGAVVILRGRGSQFIDPSLGRESSEPLHLFLEHPRPEGLASARQLAVNLVETLVQELQQTEFSQQMNVPLQLSVPPPLPPQQQQLFTAPPQIQLDHSMIINATNNAQQVSGKFQVQQVEQPPPLRPPTHINIPPPGVHIPQHAGPLVPPPQLMQLTAPPPPVVTTAQPPPVLVVAPPPQQPLYLPSDLVSSSIGTFSLLQGGVMYHQAPPVQTQAQIGDAHTQPPPQMIITQLQVDANGQIIAPTHDQITHNFQQTSQKFHVIGQVQNQLNRDDGVQQQQIVRQNQDTQNNDNFSHYNQNSNANITMIQSPYQMSIAGTSTNMATMTVTNQGQNQIRQINMGQNQGIQMQQVDQDKLPSRQMIQGPVSNQDQKQENAKSWLTNMRNNNQNQMQQNPPPSIQQSQEQTPQAMMSQMPPNRLPSQMDSSNSNQFQANNQYSNQPGNNQQLSNQMNIIQHESNNQQRTMPPNQYYTMDKNQMPLISQQQIGSQQNYNQQENQLQQIHQQPSSQQSTNSYDSNPESSRKDSRRHDDQGGSRSSGRNRRGSSNNRQYIYPWSRNDQDRPNQQGDLNWQRKESIREFEYERKLSDFQRNNDNRSRFSQHGGENIKSDDIRQSTQYRDNEDEDNSNSQGSPNQGNQRNAFTCHSDSRSSMMNQNRSDTDGQRKDRSPDQGRKRRFNQELTNDSPSPRTSRSDSADSGKSGHKKRFDSEDYKVAGAGSQGSRKFPSKSSKPADSKNDKSGPIKWSDMKGDLANPENVEKAFNQENKHYLDKESPNTIGNTHSQQQADDTKDKPMDANVSKQQQQIAPWMDQRNDPKNNMQQYTNTQFQGQPPNNNDSTNRQYTNYQSTYMSTPQIYQGSLPYHLLPPPPPPPSRPSQTSITRQNSMQYSQGNTNVLMGHTNIHQGYGQQAVSQHNIQQSLPPNLNTQLQSNMNTNVTQNIPNNVQQNTSYDMGQNMMNNNMGQHMAPSMNQNIPSNMPINQNIPINMGQNSLTTTVRQNMSPNIGTMMPNQQQNMPPQPMITNMGQNSASYMSGNNMAQNIQHNMTMNSNMGQNMSNMNSGHQNIPTNMGQQMINQNMAQGISTMLGTNSPMNIPNQNISMNMQPMGQIGQSMVPSMVPPPGMMPLTRPHLRQHTMTSVPPPHPLPNFFVGYNP